jgi:hypothetical protein
VTNAAPHSVRSPTAATARAQLLLSLTMIAAIMFGGAAAIVGLRMALHARVIPCPDGTYVSQGATDMRCFSHPHAGEGAGLTIVAVLLTLLILLVAWQLRIALGIAVVAPDEPAAAAPAAGEQPPVSESRQA